MAQDKNATIQQHQPLRTPEGWNKQEKMLLVQLDEILDDIYRRFGRLRIADLGKDLRQRIEDDEGNISQIAIDLGQISLEVGNKYDKVSGISIASNGIDLTGAKYIRLNSGSSILIKSGSTFTVDSGNFGIDSEGNAFFKGGGEFSGELKAATGTFNGTLSAACITSGLLDSERINVETLFARQATIDALNAADISGNTYLQLAVNSKNKTYRQWATPSDPHDGDTWYKQAPQPISEMQNYTHAELAQYPYWAFDGYQLYRYENNAWRKIDDPAEIRSTVSRLLMENDRIDIAVMQLDSEMDNKYTVRSGIAIELDGIEISGSKYLRLKTGGKLVVDSGNFDIDENGNVRMNGEIIATTGRIGGFNIGATRQSAGSGSNYICLDSGTANFDYFIMAGGESAANAKFLLTKEGHLTVESLTVRSEQGTTQQIDLSNYALWKLNYNVVKSYTATSITLSNGATINFNSAAGLVLDGEWNENALIYEVIASNGQGQIIGTDTSTAAYFDKNQAGYKAALEASGAHQVMVKVAPSGHDGISMLIDASGVYSQGYTVGENTGKASIYITDIGQQSAPTYSNGYYTVHARADASNGRYMLDDLSVDASAAYNAGWNAALAACGIPGGGDVRTGGTYYASLYVMNQSGPSRVGSGYVGVNSTHVDAKS